jgi:hypothetical protein
MNDGGQAFPFSAPVEFGALPLYGMSLRDWFAGQALAGIANPNMTYDRAAASCYAAADAMLRERNKPREEST